MTQTAPYEDAKSGAAFAEQSFGDFQNFHPHLHVLAADGCFYTDGTFMVCPSPNADDLEELFRYEVFKPLRAETKISDAAGRNYMPITRDNRNYGF